MEVTLVDAGPRLGGVCLHHGCIPSKALLHVAKLIGEAREAEPYGIRFGAPEVDLERLRTFVGQGVIGRLAGGVEGLCKARGVAWARGRAVFEDSQTVRIEGDGPGRIRFEHAILAVGSRPLMLKGLAIEDPRVMDSTAALRLPDIPGRLLVIGGGYIGLE